MYIQLILYNKDRRMKCVQISIMKLSFMINNIFFKGVNIYERSGCHQNMGK